ncbi:hypothetical protein HELRODRAFT_163896 [Helobdella robusta]|uniref:C2H2-type domain-containing protein n=1 Tax=Helobdella robusta TaxID=6412 RepID=T1EUL2_HELRO|nr:hypothetical protein HELRODRAFT_163896 [Helobdella robusta]ESN96774.1 hypothetical protein HELRODRAFT_163896 [Helobdella robusta]
MDSTKLLCPTLSVVLVKTIKALCEINIKYDSKLEITGSLHVRSDGQKVLTCLLDEESVKGQHDAARIAELATRLSMAAATFPFAHLQIPATVNHHNHHHTPQQLAAELYLSSSGGDVHLVNANMQQSSVAMQVERVAALREDNNQQLQAIIPQQLTVGLGSNAQLTTAVYHHHLHLKQPDSNSTGVQMLVQESNEEIRINQATVRPFENLVAKLPNQQLQQQQTNQQQQQQQSRKSKHSQHIQNESTNRINLSLKESPPSSIYERNLATPSSQNHIKLPDIQTLAHSLPKYPNQKLKSGVVASFINSSGHQVTAVDLQSSKSPDNLNSSIATYAYIPHSLQQQQQQQLMYIEQQQMQQSLQQQQQQQQDNLQSDSTPPSLDGPPIIESMVSDDSHTNSLNNGTFPNDSTSISMTTSPSLTSSTTSTSTSAKISTSSDLEAAISRRKKFQCMFCGIFLSTKCYLKNHVNAVHTRARVYPCELCERFFYSAGALRIHKLRNHWHGAKKHVCGQCGETFLLPIELRKHLVKKHFIISPDGVVDNDNSLITDNNNSQQFKMEDVDLPMPQLHPENLEAATAAAVLLNDTSLVCTPVSICYRSSPRQLNSEPPLTVEDSHLG